MDKRRSMTDRRAAYNLGRADIRRHPGYTPARAARAVRRLLVVLRFIAWRDALNESRTDWFRTPRRLSGKCPIPPTFTRFAYYNSKLGNRFSEKTLRTWVHRYEARGAVALLDYRGRNLHPRVVIDEGLLRQTLWGIGQGQSVARLHAELRPIAQRDGLRWPSLRTVQERVRRMGPLVKRHGAEQ
jgi:hypothetical protein